jgi:uncharacterized OB-fold protein
MYTNTTTGQNVKFVYEDMNNHEENPKTGWVCPKCGRVISPDLKTCPYCSTQQTDERLNPGEQIICD